MAEGTNIQEAKIEYTPNETNIIIYLIDDDHTKVIVDSVRLFVRLFNNGKDKKNEKNDQENSDYKILLVCSEGYDRLRLFMKVLENGDNYRWHTNTYWVDLKYLTAAHLLMPEIADNFINIASDIYKDFMVELAHY